MTVPTDFRRNSEIPGILVLYHADIPEADIKMGQGFKFTGPLRTILDLIESGTAERHFIRQAVRQAIDRVLITRQQIRNARTARSTVDIDLTVRRVTNMGGSGTNEVVRDMLQIAANVPLGDSFEFVIGSPVMDLMAAPHGGARYRIEARMDERLHTPTEFPEWPSEGPGRHRSSDRVR